MALEGNLQDFSLADMMRLLESGAKTGSLELTRDDERAIVSFREGRVCYAASPRYSEPLARRLVTEGIVSENQLRQALGLQKIQTQDKAGRRLAQILIEEGFVDARTLETVVHEAIFEALLDLFLWDAGTIRFEPGDTSAQLEIGVLVSVETVLQEMTRRMDEWRRIRARISSLEAVFVISEAPEARGADIHLSPAEWLVLSELHGGRSVRELMAVTGASDFEMTRTLYSMEVAGLVAQVGGGE